MKLKALKKLYFPKKKSGEDELKAMYIDVGMEINSEDFGLSKEDIQNLLASKAITEVKEKQPKTEAKK